MISIDPDGLRVVSLGNYCGVRQSIKKAGYDAESLPFDWMRTRVEGILHYMRSDFDGFFNFVTKMDVPNSGIGAPAMVMFRDHLHSFWHDDPTQEIEREKYRRRIKRFDNLAKDNPSRVLLFVRALAQADELGKTKDLLAELCKQFGPKAKLLITVDLQATTAGPILVSSHPNLLAYFNSPAVHAAAMDGAPYEEAVRCGVAWALGQEAVGGKAVPSIEALSKLMSLTLPGTVEGLAVFEPMPKQARASDSGGPTSSYVASAPSFIAAAPFTARGATQAMVMLPGGVTVYPVGAQRSGVATPGRDARTYAAGRGGRCNVWGGNVTKFARDDAKSAAEVRILTSALGRCGPR